MVNEIVGRDLSRRRMPQKMLLDCLLVMLLFRELTNALFSGVQCVARHLDEELAVHLMREVEQAFK